MVKPVTYTEQELMFWVADALGSKNEKQSKKLMSELKKLTFKKAVHILLNGFWIYDSRVAA